MKELHAGKMPNNFKKERNISTAALRNGFPVFQKKKKNGFPECVRDWQLN